MHRTSMTLGFRASLVLLIVAIVNSAAVAQLEFGSVKALAEDDPLRKAIAARAEGDPVLLCDPPVTDFGLVTAGELVSRRFRIANAIDEPIVIIKAVSTMDSVSGGGPVRLEPLACVELTLGIRPPQRQGLDFRKRITFQIQRLTDSQTSDERLYHPPVVYDVVGRTIEAVRIVPEIIDAPGPAELLRAARRGPTLDLGHLAPGNAYDVTVVVTNDSEEPRTITSIGSDLHDVPGWVDGAATLEAGEARLLHVAFFAPRFARGIPKVTEGWTVRFDDGGQEMFLLTADLAPPPALLFESDVIDVGEIEPGKAAVRAFRAINVSGRPIRIQKVTFHGTGTLPPWPTEPIEPLGSVTIECVLRAPEARGEPRRIRMPYMVQLEDAPPQRVEICGTVPAIPAANPTKPL
ncbi:MAG: DUF1573 domain-containing protein [Phycisphaerae bacterium]|nr:DUF1573 domain-containing protein [Phycisphaerae bacterium]